MKPLLFVLFSTTAVSSFVLAGCISGAPTDGDSSGVGAYFGGSGGEAGAGGEQGGEAGAAGHAGTSSHGGSQGGTGATGGNSGGSGGNTGGSGGNTGGSGGSSGGSGGSSGGSGGSSGGSGGSSGGSGGTGSGGTGGTWPGLGPVVPHVSTGGRHACRLSADGKIFCWGANDDAQSDAPPSNEFHQVAAGERHTCALYDDGTISCWGRTAVFQLAPLGHYVQLVSGGDFSCVRDPAGKVSCFGTDSGPWNGYVFPGTFTDIAAGKDTLCGVTTTGRVNCHTSASESRGTPPMFGGTFHGLTAGATTFCALDSGNSPVCWGNPPPGTSPKQPLASISTSSAVACGLNPSGVATCWEHHGTAPLGASFAPSYPLRSISLSDGFGCGMEDDGTVVCWGSNKEGRAAPPIGTAYEVTTGPDFACAIKEDDRVACWGNNEGGKALAPRQTFKSFAAGSHHVCAIRLDGQLSCWGAPGKPESSPPAGTFIAVASGDGFSCAIRSDHHGVCWGGQNKPAWNYYYDDNDGFKTLDAASDHICAARAWSDVISGQIKCWGPNSGFSYDYQQGQYDQVATGHGFTCAMDSNGYAHCWGANDIVSSTPHFQIKAIAAGRAHVCVLRREDKPYSTIDGVIHCWGDDAHGQASPPQGRYSYLTAYADHSCASGDDGRVVCWGADSDEVGANMAPGM